METSLPYEEERHEVPDYTERIQSQLPALHLLMKMGWQYLPPAETVRLRDGRLGSAILEPILAEHIRTQCRFDFKGQSRPFTENAIANAIQALKAFRATGASHQNEQIYDLLCLGIGTPQTIDGDTKSFNIAFIDWKNPARNTYHCAAEFKVERIGHQKHYVSDIVLFVNGIPLVVIECKRSAYTDARKDPIVIAIKQLADYQAADGIPQLFLYSQLLMSLARDKAEYGTTGTERKFWSKWQESNQDDAIVKLLAGSGDTALRTWDHLFLPPFDGAAQEFREILMQGRAVTEQDRLVYALCRPERLLELIFKYIVFDDGIKKIARYQQYFAVNDILARVRAGDPAQPRAGGVVWHTQGSGKSLTMVMLAKSLALAPDILNPKIVLVTDRVDLDEQIEGTFRACGLEPEKAATGANLVELLLDQKAHVVTTVIHKFTVAARNRKLREASRNTFVLVDEGHRSNYNELQSRMRQSLNGACYIAFTGTPLAKSAKRNTFLTFGPLFQPPYTIAMAVKDGAVVPLVYEARHVPQPVDKAAIDGWFEKVTLGLSADQKADLKRQFATEGQLNKAVQKVRMIAWDASLHYASNYQGTGMKGQLVAPDKATALLYRKFFNEFGKVSCQVLISPPDEHEGDKLEAEPGAEEKVFWNEMMARYGNEKKYNKQLINAFKHGDEPEIIIVVDKLLTGFDAPCNAVMYLARKLKNHTVLQAIARVNRLFEGKEYGLILDYSGVLEDLDEAIDFYSKLAEYDPDDLVQTITRIEEETARLPQLHSDLWELFTAVRGSKDHEAYESLLRDPELRNRFYDRFGLFARTLALALSSTSFLEKTPERIIAGYKKDLKFFQNLRAAVSVRFQERVDFSEYEPRIRKLVDTHVGAGEVMSLGKPINLFDAGERQRVLEDQGKSTEAKADMIASATRKIIESEMGKDPAFYRKFSQLLEQVLADLEAKRVAAVSALSKLADIATKVATHTDEQVPKELVGQDMARRFYGSMREAMAPYVIDKTDPTPLMALAIVKRIGKFKIRDWRDNSDALNRMRLEIDDVCCEVSHEMGIELPLDMLDKLRDMCIEIAIANED
ncbi:MAG: HsdR family type I site-specific deoxyribonuclease [Kiritimatiellia bacterium]